ncbi:carbon catabolite repressor protein 4 homolog 1-like isoform X2 [Acanthaster planci]|uniref:Carbon catabolite repressor protein 4 homolog 1-like isoform X2 n=1 Tax=Acanthaster planci TaxID=133434 RepID=A0A8B7Y6V2_ACAPL|nr:carbon catabolite repressor protein 4 homolog 1-like isoform X2 [Acanthaster planci]
MSLSANLQREWVPNQTLPTAGLIVGDFVVMTYNLLNKDLGPDGLFSYCPDELLSTARRHPVLMGEIDHHKDADIICFQEVSSLYYDETLVPDMHERGYTGAFIKRPSARSADDKRPWTDGSATFFRSARFQLVKQEGGHFKDLFEKEQEKLQSPTNTTSCDPDLIDSKRSFLFVLFRCLETDRLVAVGNVHLTCVYGSYNRMDLNSLEAAFALRELVRFCGGADAPHILCGDFNFEEHHPGYQLMRDGLLSEASATYLRNLRLPGEKDGSKNVMSLLDVFPDFFTHDSVSLKSSYKTVMGHEPPFTCYEDSSPECATPVGPLPTKALQALFDVALNYTKGRGADKYVAAVDYIWFSSSSLHCSGALRMPEERLILPFHACPNAVFPSDHLLMKAQFSFLKA